MVTFVFESAAQCGASDDSDGDGNGLVFFSYEGAGESTITAFVFVVADAFAFESAAQCGASDDSDDDESQAASRRSAHPSPSPAKRQGGR